jgi:DNA-binding transcriptional MocR family regulator
MSVCRAGAPIHGSEHGTIPYSVREGAKELGISKTTVSRSLERLIDHGFIAVTQKGHFDYKVRHATEWRLTEFDYGNDLATKDFMRWQLPGGSLATAPCGARFASRVVPSERVPPGKLEVSLS